LFTQVSHSELSVLSRKLNQKSDKTNEIITTINKKLAALNFCLEVWLDYPALGAPSPRTPAVMPVSHKTPGIGAAI
jgi:hypothetical protein